MRQFITHPISTTWSTVRNIVTSWLGMVAWTLLVVAWTFAALHAGPAPNTEPTADTEPAAATAPDAATATADAATEGDCAAAEDSSKVEPRITTFVAWRVPAWSRGAIAAIFGTCGSIGDSWVIGFGVGSFILGLAVIAVVATARDRPGPVTVAEVRESTDGAHERSDLRAIIEDRLARVGIQPPSTVPAILASEGAVTTPTAVREVPEVVLRVLTRLRARDSKRVGYTLHVLHRRSDRATDQEGMTFRLASNATGRQLLADTTWAPSPQEAARQVAFRVAAFLNQLSRKASTGRVPTWSPDPVSLRCYEDASYFIRQGRLDEAATSCERALNTDPNSLPVRYLLGTLHERLGYFLNAIDVYVDALNVLLHDGTAFSRTSRSRPPDAVPAVRSGLQPAGVRRGRPRFRRIVSDEATQIVWRYIGCLTFADRWTQRWVDDLRRSEGGRPKAPIGYRKTTRDRVGEASGAAQSTFKQLEATEMAERTETARRLRGFFNVRLESLLDEYPLLRDCVFGDDRASPLNSSANTLRPCVPPVASELSAAMMTDELRPGGARRDAVDPLTAVGWLIWLLDVAVNVAGTDVPIPPSNVTVTDARQDWLNRIHHWTRSQAGRPAPDFNNAPKKAIEAETLQMGNAELVDDVVGHLRLLRDTLAHPSPARGHLLDARIEALRRGGYSRQRIAFFCYRIGRDLLAIDGRRLLGVDPSAQDDIRQRIAFVVAHLDLRLLFFRAALDEIDVLNGADRLGRRELWARPFLSPQLSRVVEAGTRYRCVDRIHELAVGVGDTLVAEHRARAARSAADPLRWRDRAAEWMRGYLTKQGTWNLWYYQACVLAQTLDAPPDRPHTLPDDVEAQLASSRARFGSADGAGRGGDAGDDAAYRYEQSRKAWVTANDAAATMAVEALNRATTIRGKRGRTALEAGIGSWLLFYDPDLDRLRSHPRFARWSTAMFEADPPEFESVGLYDIGKLSSWRLDQAQRLVRLTNEVHTAAVLREPALAIAHRWQPGPTEVDAPSSTIALWHDLDRDVRAWTDLVGLPRLIAHPRSRARLWRMLHDMTEMSSRYPEFPRSSLVLREGRPMRIDETISSVCDGIDGATRDLARVTTVLGDGGTLAQADADRIRKSAALRWWSLAEALTPDRTTPTVVASHAGPS